MDVADAEQVKAGFRQVTERFGRLDILVNNAAVTRDGLAVRMKADDWDAVLRTNLTGAHLCIQQALGLMLRQRYGRIINMTSVVAQTGNAGQANYVAAKAGLIGLTRAIAVEVASRNITVNAVAPGFIVSPDDRSFTAERKGCPASAGAARTHGMLTRKLPQRSFSSPAKRRATSPGHVLDVNGGLEHGLAVLHQGKSRTDTRAGFYPGS